MKLSIAAESVTFEVDAVSLATSPLKTCKVREAVQALLDAPPDRHAADESSQGNPACGRLEACWNYSLDCVSEVTVHPLIAATHLAFSQHRPLSLSPDVIWVTIAQGLAQHIRLMPERHRSLLVPHQGRKELTVVRGDLHRGSPENPWADVIANFVTLARQHLGEFGEQAVCDFSTTGPVERTVSEVALLDIVQPYFSFRVVCVCGIPAITLEGTAADWQKLRDKVELLAPFDIDWWLYPLRAICDQFVRAASGDVDVAHWQTIYKLQEEYGGDVINGWIAKLFPYLKDSRTGTFSNWNPLLHPNINAQSITANERIFGKHWYLGIDTSKSGLHAESLPRGLSVVPFTLQDTSGKRAMEFVAGPLAVTQDEEKKTLRPILGWAVRESATIEEALVQQEGSPSP